MGIKDTRSQGKDIFLNLPANGLPRCKETAASEIKAWHGFGKVRTWLHSILCVPDGKAITIEVFFPLPVDSEMHLHLPVSQVTRLLKAKKKKKDAI